MSFLGYQRDDGSVGIRNKILVIALSDCCEPVARKIASTSKDAVSITQHHGCINDPIIINTLIGVSTNPNVGAVLLIMMGCEGMDAELIVKGIEKNGKPFHALTMQHEGGTQKTIKAGCNKIAEFQCLIDSHKRVEAGFEKLIVGVKCGGSDATNGISGNPAVGVASDLLIDAGGTVILSEPIEALGAENFLMDRAINDQVRGEIKTIIENEFRRYNIDKTVSEVMCKGNYKGGLSTIEEKALGAVLKSGTKNILGVLKVNKDVIEKPYTSGGCYFQDGTHLEPMAMTLMAAAGAQLIVYVSGRGGVLGHAILPFLNVNGNPGTCIKMSDDIDICAGGVIDGSKSLSSIGREVFESIVTTSNGFVTKSEKFGYDNFSVFTRDQRLEDFLGIK